MARRKIILPKTKINHQGYPLKLINIELYIFMLPFLKYSSGLLFKSVFNLKNIVLTVESTASHRYN